MGSLFGRKHRLQVSLTNADGSGAGHTGSSLGEEDTTVAFNLREGHKLSDAEVEIYDPEQEAGQTSHLIDEGKEGSPIAYGGTKSVSLLGDDRSLGFFSYFAANGNETATAAQIGTSGVYEQNWTAVSTTAGVPQTGLRSFTMAEVNSPDTDDQYYNIVHPNCVIERTRISGRAKQPILVEADIRTGGEESTEFEVAPDLITTSRNRAYNMGHVLFNANGTGAGWNTFDSQTIFDFASAQTVSSMASGGEWPASFPGSPVEAQNVVREFSLELTQDVDTVNSYTAGNYESSNYAQIVKWNDDWKHGPQAQQIELEVLAKIDAPGGDDWPMVARDSYRSWGQFAVGLFIIHPNFVSGTPNAWYGFGFGMKAQIISAREETNGMGEKLMRVRFRAGLNESAPGSGLWVGPQFVFTSSESTPLGS